MIVPFSPDPCQQELSFILLFFAILIGICQILKVILINIYLMPNDVENLSASQPFMFCLLSTLCLDPYPIFIEL